MSEEDWRRKLSWPCQTQAVLISLQFSKRSLHGECKLTTKPRKDASHKWLRNKNPPRTSHPLALEPNVGMFASSFCLLSSTPSSSSREYFCAVQLRCAACSAAYTAYFIQWSGPRCWRLSLSGIDRDWILLERALNYDENHVLAFFAKIRRNNSEKY